MKTIQLMAFSSVAMLVLSCGVASTASDAGPPPNVDESLCAREKLESDGLDSDMLRSLDGGAYVISSTYLRLKRDPQTLKLFGELNGPLGEALGSNPGLIQAVTRVSESCNSARTLTVWKDEAAMYSFVASKAHAAAVAAVLDISRGGSLVTHWNDDGTGFNWQTATVKIGKAPGPFY